MDMVFFLDEEARAARDSFLGTLAQDLGCTYLCLWSYYPAFQNHLICTHGWLNDIVVSAPSTSNYKQHIASSSTSSSSSQISSTVARTLFDMYRQSICNTENGCVPGLAYKEGVPYIELKDVDLLNRASSDVQRQFYQEARIKAAVFMGCKSGEIEIGISNPNQINMEMELKKLFPDDFSTQQQPHSKAILRDLIPRGLGEHNNWNNSPISSSSLRSLSVGSSPENSSLLLPMISSSSPFATSDIFLKEFNEQTIIRPHNIPMAFPPNQLQSFTPHGRNILFPNADRTDEEITKAMLAVMSSSSSSPSSSYQSSKKVGAFRKYVPNALAPNTFPTEAVNSSQGQIALKRAFGFYRNMYHYVRRNIEQEQAAAAAAQLNRPTISQLQHKMSERKRREKLNESFESLKSLLPPGSKKHKASLLSNAIDYVTSLKAEIAELKRKNQLLEAQHAPSTTRSSATASVEAGGSTVASNPNVEILINQADESAILDEREIDLQVTVRGECNNAALVIRILEFLNQVENISLIHMEARSHSQALNSIHQLIFTLKIKGNEYDRSAFQEAIRRIVADVAR